MWFDEATETPLAEAVRAAMQAKYQWGGGLIIELKPISP